MADRSAIEWTTATRNPTTGISRASMLTFCWPASGLSLARDAFTTSAWRRVSRPVE